MVTSGAIGKLRTALARPLDRTYPTNLAVMILAPAAALALGGVTFGQTHSLSAALEAAMRGALTTFGGWALAREIAPDDNPGAFVSMALAFVAVILVPSSSVLPLFTAIMLARILNRSVGIPATLVDSIAVVLLVAWTVAGSGNPWPALVGAAGFALDAVLPVPLRRQLAFAAICLTGGVGYLILRGSRPAGDGNVTPWFPIVTIALLYAVLFLRTRRIHSVADLTGEPLNLHRVRAAMAIGWLMAAQGAILGGAALAQSAIIWAVLAGLVLSAIYRPFWASRRSEPGV